LQAWYAHAKKYRRGFSFRSFSLRAGSGSPTFLKRIMDGERGLTDDSLLRTATALGLNKSETEFFTHLVNFNQATDAGVRERHYEALLKSRQFSELRPIESAQYEFYSEWYHPVIRELALSADFDGTPDWLSSSLSPLVSVGQAARSLALLLELGFLTKDAQGHFHQASPVITTGPEATDVIMHKYHHNLLTLAQALMPRVRAEERDISALTLGIRKGRVPELKKIIQEFRKNVLKLVADDNVPDDVVLLSVQLLPVTRLKDKKSRKLSEPKSDKTAAQEVRKSS
jgi:uncharacterized protein (TIGR02147 family)